MIPPKLYFLHNIALKLYSQNKKISEVACHIEELQAEEIDPPHPLYTLENELERATQGVPGHSSLQGEMAIATAIHSRHDPVIRYLLKNCLVHPHGFEYLGGHYRKSGSIKNRIPSGRMDEVLSAAYCMTDVCHQYFGHWLQDACPAVLLSQPDEAIILDIRSDWAHASEYAAAFDFRSTQVVGPLFVRELSFFQDYSQGSLKRSRYAVLRKRLENAFGSACAPAQPVYVRRGTSGAARVISNEETFMKKLVAEGFAILDIAASTSAEIYHQLARASLIVSVEGSHMNHTYFSAPSNANILTMIPSDRFTLTQHGYAAAAGMNFGAVVMERSDSGYHIDIDRVFRTIDLMP